MSSKRLANGGFPSGEIAAFRVRENFTSDGEVGGYPGVLEGKQLNCRNILVLASSDEIQGDISLPRSCRRKGLSPNPRVPELAPNDAESRDLDETNSSGLRSKAACRPGRCFRSRCVAPSRLPGRSGLGHRRAHRNPPRRSDSPVFTPKECDNLARGIAPGTRPDKPCTLKGCDNSGASHSLSIPDVPLVVLDTVLLQELAKLLLERHPTCDGAPGWRCSPRPSAPSRRSTETLP